MEKLFDGFSPVSAFEWKARIEKDLKEIPFETLLKKDRNGITIKPFYNQEDLQNQARALFTNPDWDICTLINVNDEKTANQQALFALKNGASGLCFKIHTSFDLELLLKDILIQHIYLQFDIKENHAAFLVNLKNLANERGLRFDQLNCCINYDSIANLLSSGNWNTSSRAEQLNYILTSQSKPSLVDVCVDAKIYQNMGANTSFELAATLAHVNEYLNWLQENDVIQHTKKIHVSLAVGTEFFEEIAKLRAFRKLSALLFESYEIQADLHIHCETSNIYRSSIDSYTNLLRDSISGMAAVLGGCNTLVINAFNGKTNDEFSARMSRNQQLVFKEEAYLNKVADVSAGSFYIESLTEQIAEKAWSEFQQLEKQGGLIVSFNKGILKQALETQSKQLVEDYKSGKRVLIGVNKYPNPTDTPKKKSIHKSTTNKLESISLSEELLAH